MVFKTKISPMAYFFYIKKSMVASIAIHGMLNKMELWSVFYIQVFKTYKTSSRRKLIKY